MMRSLLFILLLSSTLHISAQVIDWAIPLPVESHLGGQLFIHGIASSEEHVHVCGPVEHESLDPYGDLLIVSYDLAGQEVHSSTIEGEAICSELIYFDDHLYVLGRFRNDLVFENGELVEGDGAVSSFLAKVDLDGTPVWIKNFNSGSVPVVFDMAISPSGILFISEQYGLYTTGALKQFDLDGNEIASWVHENTSVTEIVFDPAGFVYQYGTALDMVDMVFNGTIVPNPHIISRFVLKYDLDGNVIYCKIFKTVDFDFSRLIPADNGEVYLAMVPSGEEVVDGFQFDFGHWVFSTAIVRLDAEGTILWLRDIGMTEQDQLGDGSFSYGHSLVRRGDDGLYISGVMRHYMDWGSGFLTDFEDNGASGFVWGLDSQGTTDFVMVTEEGQLGSLSDLTTSNENDYYSLSTGMVTDFDFGGAHVPITEDKLAVLFKWQAEAVGIDESETGLSISHYLDRSTDRLEVLGVKENAVVKIVDIAGRDVLSTRISPSVSAIDISPLHSATYVMQLIQEGRVVYTAKLVVTD